jgi:hypothetical protein
LKGHDEANDLHCRGSRSGRPPGRASIGSKPIRPRCLETPATQEPRRPRKREKAKKGEMSVKGMAASERRKKCGVEWKEAKAAGRTEGLKWPKFYSQVQCAAEGQQRLSG